MFMVVKFVGYFILEDIFGVVLKVLEDGENFESFVCCLKLVLV